jgi:hypothetical protein
MLGADMIYNCAGGYMQVVREMKFCNSRFEDHELRLSETAVGPMIYCVPPNPRIKWC